MRSVSRLVFPLATLFAATLRLSAQSTALTPPPAAQPAVCPDRFDLRAVYQAVCHNQPRADEPSYPLWHGLPLTSTMTRAELASRVDECTDVRKTADARTAQQQRNLQDILGVVAIPESALISHLNWGTWHFQDITTRRPSSSWSRCSTKRCSAAAAVIGWCNCSPMTASTAT